MRTRWRHLSGETRAYLILSLVFGVILLPLTLGVVRGDILKKDTAANIKLGPFLSMASYAPSSGTTITFAISKNGAAWGAPTTATAVTDATGWCTAALSTSDTATAGNLTLKGTGTGVMQCFARNQVVVANWFNGMFTTTLADTNAAKIEDADPTDTIRDSVVDDATRVDASALNTLSGHDPGANLGTSTLTQTQVTGGAYALDTDANGRIRIVDGTSAGEIDTNAGLVQLLAATQASIDAIETDTGTTLEGHLTDIKGTGFAKDTHSLPQCLTATGFSTLDAAGVATAVWNAATATYGSAGSYGLLLETDLDAAISSRAASATALSNATWTDAKAGYLTAAVATATALATSDGKLDTLSTRLSAARAGYLDNLSAGAVALAATALSNATWTDAKAGYLTGAVATAAALTTVGDNVVLILADTGELQTDWHDGGRLDLLLDASGDPWSTALPGAYGAGTAGYIVGTYVDAAISGIAAVVGAGATPYTLTITTGAGAPVGEVRTWVTTDAAGTNVTAGPVSTADDGTVTFYLDSGVTYYRWCKKGGYTFTNPKEFTVP